MEKMEDAVSIVTKFDIEALTKREAIGQLVMELDQQGFVNNYNGFLADVFEREAELPTYIGHHIGLPHSQSDYVERAVVAIGKLKTPIIWNDDKQVNLIFLIAVQNSTEENLHLKILANLSRMLIHDDFRDKLLTLDEDAVKQLMYDHMTVK